MGDMADYYLNLEMDSGKEFDSGCDWIPSSRPKYTLRCRHCKSTNVFWKTYPSGKWFLWDKDTQKPHKCKQEG